MGEREEEGKMIKTGIKMCHIHMSTSYQESKHYLLQICDKNFKMKKELIVRIGLMVELEHRTLEQQIFIKTTS